MPEPWTPRRHFDQDIVRARSLLELAQDAQGDLLRGDVARNSVATAVGAMDAYLCDAYVGLLVATVRGFQEGSVDALPTGLHKETLPIGPLFSRRYSTRANWALRMAARTRMERENMLQVSRVKDVFNPFLPVGSKLWSDVIDSYVSLDLVRLTRWRAADLAAVQGNALAERRRQAGAALVTRVGVIVQRRHDVVHNCDRPKAAIQGLTWGQARAMVRDVASFVTILDDHLTAHRIA